MVETAYLIMENKREPYYFYDLLSEVAKVKGFTEEEKKARISFLYTDMNIDGRFLTLGDNQWGLKAWYLHEQSEEEITVSAHPEKHFDVDDELEDDAFEDLEDELDELAEVEDGDEEEDDLADEKKGRHLMEDEEDEDDFSS